MARQSFASGPPLARAEEGYRIAMTIPADRSPTVGPICYRPIGVLHSPWREATGTPIQPSGARGVRGTLVLDPALAPALTDLDGFSHVILIYHCHRAGEASLLVTPYLDARPHGVLATRAPARPNPIGLSVLRLVAVEGTVLTLDDVDILDGTPVLDVKPFVPAFDVPDGEVRIGWLVDRAGEVAAAVADRRFAREP